uniref:LAGLIDADG homing endonuclease n=1 Tax=Rhizoctonia solani TaxID=456999 RepID=A0A8E8GT30_9AGAM|nr:LAGLIDADG homing endonuclease [Rhizoctonia solani]
MEIFSELFIFSLIPIKPDEDKPQRRLKRAEQAAFSLSPELTGILVGLFLGDLYVQKRKPQWNPTLKFKQGIINSQYLMHLYGLFQSYCPSAPKVHVGAPNKITGKINSYIAFHSYSLSCFNELYDLFYPNGKKVVPQNIGDLLTPSGLCYWICDDGYWDDNATFLCTNAFSLEEVNLLVKVLADKFNLKCSILRQKNGYVIRISSYSMPHLHTLVGSIIPPMMQYKVFGKS